LIVRPAHVESHPGGLIDGAGRPVFSRAVHHVFQAEADFWTAAVPDVAKMRMDAADMIRMARRVFAGIEFRFPAPGAEVVPGIRVFLSPGHTPGHMTLA
jgi:glyoxylase-like metal-dependent hydrolase (beta-lactamase superfamily II)